MNAKPLPRYTVGEVVLFRSMKYPELSGEYTIRCIHYNEDKYIDRASKVPTIVVLNHVPFAYRFTEVLTNDKGQELLVTEAQLRKKHTPGTVSFRRLMELV